MDLRAVALIGVLASTACLHGAPLKVCPLDPTKVVTIAIATDAPTTCLFPRALAGIEAANLSTKAEDRPPVLLSHQAGSRFFSVRALLPEARASLNVLLEGEVYALNFIAADEPDRTVKFVAGDEPAFDASASPQTVMLRSEHFALAQQQAPELLRGVTRVSPKTITRYRTFAVTVQEVHHHRAEDLIVLLLNIHNESNRPLVFRGEEVAVRVGRQLLPAIAVRGDNCVPPNRSVPVIAAFGKNVRGDSLHLSPLNTFTVVLPHDA